MVQNKIRGRRALPPVAVGVLTVSASATFIRLADVPAVVFWRCALGVALLLPPALLRRERLPRGRILYVGLPPGGAGCVLRVLDLLTRPHEGGGERGSLVSTHPMFVAILAHLLSGERTSPLSPSPATSPLCRVRRSSRATIR